MQDAFVSLSRSSDGYSASLPHEQLSQGQYSAHSQNGWQSQPPPFVFGPQAQASEVQLEQPQSMFFLVSMVGLSFFRSPRRGSPSRRSRFRALQGEHVD